jgi:CarD family transcriptional regulator
MAGVQSSSERAIYEAALDRLACEIAAVEGIDKAAATARIHDQVTAPALT